MRFRPANIRLINRRFHLTRLPLALCSKTSTTNPLVRRLTGSLHISPCSYLEHILFIRRAADMTRRAAEGSAVRHSCAPLLPAHNLHQ
jgi:hypothetical protein